MTVKVYVREHREASRKIQAARMLLREVLTLVNVERSTPFYAREYDRLACAYNRLLHFVDVRDIRGEPRKYRQ